MQKCQSLLHKVRTYFTSIIDVAGWKLFFLIVIVQLFIKGIQYNIVLRCLFPILSYYYISPVKLQLYSVIVGTPWTFKPLIGIISDLFPIFGYHKRYYHLIFTIISSLVSLYLAISNSNNPIIITFVFFVYSYETVTLDLLTESKCNELMRNYPEIRNNISTFIQLLNAIGGLIMNSIIGPLFDDVLHSSDNTNNNTSVNNNISSIVSTSTSSEIDKIFVIFYWFSFVIAVIPLISYRWYAEMYIEYPYRKWYSKIITFDSRKWEMNKKMFIIIIVAAISGPIAALSSGMLSIYIGIVFSITMLTMSIVGSYFTMPRIIAKVTLFVILIGLNKPYLGTALDYFYTAKPDCFPDGPNFDYTYYITWTGMIGYLAQLVGILFYRLYLVKFKFRTVLIITFIISSVAGLTDLAMILKWNRYLDIPDKYFYMFASAMMGNLTYILWYIPVSTIISIISPMGIESTIFAFMIGIYNFADQLNYINGSLLYELFHINCTCSEEIISTTYINETVNNTCNFDNLWLLVLCSYIIGPLVIGIPATLLIPNVYQNENLLCSENKMEQKLLT